MTFLALISSVILGTTPLLSGMSVQEATLLHESQNFSDAEWNFVLGYIKYREGKYQEAFDQLKDVESPSFILRDHLLFLRGSCALELKNFQEALSLMRQLHRDHPSSVWEGERHRVTSEALLGLGRYEEARREFALYRKENPSPQEQWDADLLFLQSFIEAKEPGEAIPHARKLILQVPSEEALDELSPLLDRVDQNFKSGLQQWMSLPDQRLLIAESFEQHAHWDDAARWYASLLETPHLSPSLIVKAKWRLGVSLVWIHRYEEGLKALQEALEMPEGTPFRSGISHRILLTLIKMARYDEALKMCRNILAKSNSSLSMGRYHQHIATILFHQGKFRESMTAWKEVLRHERNKKDIFDIQWRIAWCYWKLGEFQESFVNVDALLKGVKKHSYEYQLLSYWKGRILEKMGREKEARSIYTSLVSQVWGYYPELAKRRMEKDERTPSTFATVAWEGQENSSWKGDLPSPTEALGLSTHFARALALDQLGLSEEVGRELKAVERKEPVPRESMLWLAAKNGIYDLSYTQARYGFTWALRDFPHNDGFDRYVWQQVFPKAYEHFVDQAVGKSGLDPRIVYSLMSAESNFRPRIVSPVGAIGLMQLMPTTAAKVAAALGEESFDSHTLYEPKVNIAMGVGYLQKLMKLFPNNSVAWIASYNAGEEAVARWIDSHGITDIEEFIEEIPFRETNFYVKKVLANYWVQQRLYNH